MEKPKAREIREPPDFRSIFWQRFDALPYGEFVEVRKDDAFKSIKRNTGWRKAPVVGFNLPIKGKSPYEVPLELWLEHYGSIPTESRHRPHTVVTDRLEEYLQARDLPHPALIIKGWIGETPEHRRILHIYGKDNVESAKLWPTVLGSYGIDIIQEQGISGKTELTLQGKPMIQVVNESLIARTVKKYGLTNTEYLRLLQRIGGIEMDARKRVLGEVGVYLDRIAEDIVSGRE